MRILSIILSVFLLLSLSACGTADSDRNPTSSATGSEMSEEDIQKAVNFGSFEMTLVNSQNPLEEDFKPELSEIDETFASPELLFATVGTENLHRLCRAAKDAGMNLLVSSAWEAADPSKPETLEHQLGLAVDFNSAMDGFDSTREYQWLISNCADFGFILRYSEDKTDKTGVASKPWHFRYVGIENARIIEKTGLCLEEFIEEYIVFE